MQRRQMRLPAFLFLVSVFTVAAANGYEEIRLGSLGPNATVFSGEFPRSIGDEIRIPGDVNGDGFDDVLLRWYDPGLGHGGFSLVYGSTEWPREISLTDPDRRVTNFGGAVNGTIFWTAFSGDFDRDGFSDLVFADFRASFPNDPGGTDAGVLLIVYGAAELPTEIDISRPETFRHSLISTSRTTSSRLANDAHFGGDINGDGEPELLIGNAYHRT
ncbi:MAG: hypothetical protein AAF517_22940, partial [Planctomycetota bacterium]